MTGFANFQVLVFHGPDFSGKYTFFTREISHTHQAIQPSKMFRENPSLGIRDIGLLLLSHLKEGKKIAVIDTNELKRTRTSYITLLQKKNPDASVAVVSIIPKYGCEQLFWTRELRLAREACQHSAESSTPSDLLIDDAQMAKWFNNSSEIEIQYKHGVVEPPCEEEGYRLSEKVAGVYTRSDYKFEVPGLLIQWEILSGMAENRHQLSKLSKICELWSKVHPCGRIIVICDGSQLHTGEKSKSQQESEIDGCLKELTTVFTQCPVYVLHITDPKHAGCYIVPPKPGILAFLQQRHCLNLHSRRTVYIHDTSSHMKMAENAGIRNIKASRVLDHPSLIISSHAATTPSIPEMLETMKVLPCQQNPDPPVLPLSHLKNTFCAGKICQQFAHGRAEYLYCVDIETLERYEQLYVHHATKLSEAGRKMSPKKMLLSENETGTSQPPSPGQSRHSVRSSDSGNQSRLSAGSRDLPSWMVKKRRHKERTQSSDSSVLEETEKKFRKLMYVMTEKELVETACDLLRQAGKEDLVKEFLSSQNETELDISETSKKSKAGKKNEEDSGIISSRQNVSVLEKVTVGDAGNQLSSFCPKMEPEPDTDGDVILEFTNKNNKSKISENDLSVKTNADRDIIQCAVEENGASVNKYYDCPSKVEQTDKEGKHLRSKDRVENVVRDMLDEFTTSKISPKQSPRKRVRKKYTDTEGEPSIKKDHSDLEQNDTEETRASPKQRTVRYNPDLSHLDDIF